MTEVVTGEFSKYRSSLLDDHRLLKVLVFDIGSERPVPPVRPVPRKLPPGLEADIEAISMKEAVANYERQLERYVAELKEHDSWHARHSGPTIIEWWTVDWRDAATYDARAVAEGRQRRRRYYEYRPQARNMGLPADVVPGRSYAEQVERQAAQAETAAAARRDDPEFGSQP
jgi:hypothetical protein